MDLDSIVSRVLRRRTLALPVLSVPIGRAPTSVTDAIRASFVLKVPQFQIRTHARPATTAPSSFKLVVPLHMIMEK